MRNFNKVKRVVVKIGTATLSKNGAVNAAYVRKVAKQVAQLKGEGREVLIVSSGAIGMGIGRFGIERARDIKMRQACAAVGQPLLIYEYHKAFSRHDVIVAQVLLTAGVLNNRKTYLNLRNSIEKLLKLGVVPIINENDSISTEEIASAFGDNDRLSAYVASKVDADLLIMLSDIDALYDKDPRKNKDAKPIDSVYEITDDIIANAGGAGTAFAKGGMRTKLEAAKIASNAGCRMVLADGQVKDVIVRIMAAEQIGTVFMPKRKLSNRHRWILNNTPAGSITIDAGAMNALEKHKSLLASGVKGVDGAFSAGDVVMLNDFAKAVVSMSDIELEQVAGKHTRQVRQILGPERRDVVAVPEDIVLLDI
jgi:glutamate 5-kinase